MLATKKKKKNNLVDLAKFSLSSNYLKIFSFRFVFFLRLVYKHQLNAARLSCFWLLAGFCGFFSLRLIKRSIAHIHLQESSAQIYFPFIYRIILQKWRKIKANNILINGRVFKMCLLQKKKYYLNSNYTISPEMETDI